MGLKATVKQRIYDLLAKAGGEVVTTKRMRAVLGMLNRKQRCALSANLTQMKSDGLVIHAQFGAWKLAAGAIRPAGRNEHALQQPNSQQDGKQSVAQTQSRADAINALCMAPVVRL